MKAQRFVSVSFLVQFATNVIAPSVNLLRLIDRHHGSPLITHGEGVPNRGRRSLTVLPGGEVEDSMGGECRGIPKPTNFLDTPLHSLMRAFCTTGRVQSRRSSEEATMFSKLYSRAAWAARPLSATRHLRVAPMSSSAVGGKINGEWRVSRAPLRMREGPKGLLPQTLVRSLAINWIKGRPNSWLTVWANCWQVLVSG